MSKEQYLNKIRSLIQMLFISGLCNILLVAFIFFWLLRDRPPLPYFDQKPKFESGRTVKINPTNAQLIKKYKTLNFQQLFAHLSRKHWVEDGFSERDLALGVLMAFYHFDLEKALGKLPLPSQKRILSYNNDQDRLLVYARLKEEQFSSILSFVQTEKWPFKPQGLFQLLQKEQYKKEASLMDAFYVTDEFTAVEELFRCKALDRESLITLIQQGNWGILSAFHEKQKKMRDLSDEVRQSLLLIYLKAQAPQAAELLLETDFTFAHKRLSDPTVMSILRLLEQPSEKALKYINAVATSPRGDSVKTVAVAKYQELTGKEWEPLVSRKQEPLKPKAIEQAVSFKLVAKPSIIKESTQKMVPLAKKSFLYIVQEGDSLWKIAKRFSIPVNELKAFNQLQNDQLKPGSYLKVPDQSPLDAKGGTSKVVLK